MSSNFLRVHDEYRLKVSPNYTPADRDWEPALVSDDTSDPVLVGVSYGDKLHIETASGPPGPNHDRLLTIVGVFDDAGTIGFELYEALTDYTTDVTDYAFGLIKDRSQAVI